MNKRISKILGNNGSWTNLVMLTEYDRIGIKSKFFIKYIIKLKEPRPHSACFNGTYV